MAALCTARRALETRSAARGNAGRGSGGREAGAGPGPGRPARQLARPRARASPRPWRGGARGAAPEYPSLTAQGSSGAGDLGMAPSRAAARLHPSSSGRQGICGSKSQTSTALPAGSWPAAGNFPLSADPGPSCCLQASAGPISVKQRANYVLGAPGSEGFQQIPPPPLPTSPGGLPGSSLNRKLPASILLPLALGLSLPCRKCQGAPFGNSVLFLSQKHPRIWANKSPRWEWSLEPKAGKEGFTLFQSKALGGQPDVLSVHPGSL